MHLLLNKSDEKVHEDEAVRAFLTYDSKKYRHYRNNSISYFDTLKKAVPTFEQNLSLATVLKQASLSISGCAEPEELFHDGERVDFGVLKAKLVSDITILQKLYKNTEI